MPSLKKDLEAYFEATCLAAIAPGITDEHRRDLAAEARAIKNIIARIEQKHLRLATQEEEEDV